jgi:hypothetical protein
LSNIINSGRSAQGRKSCHARSPAESSATAASAAAELTNGTDHDMEAH